MSQRPTKKRKSCANPIFESWLEEWKEDATQKGSKMQYVYGRALTSLRKYPLPLSNGKECQVLEYFGTTICRQIDNRMAKEKLNFTQLNQNSQNVHAALSDVIEIKTPESNTTKTKTKKKQNSKKGTNDLDSFTLSPPSQSKNVKDKAKKKAKTYVPALRSGGYALLVALFKKEETPNYRGYMLKSELVDEAQEYCDSSFKKSDGDSHYTAWNSMKTLTTKELVLRQGNPVKFTLSEDGRYLAARLLQVDLKDNENENSSPNTSQSCDGDEDVICEDIRLSFNPGQFEVILCVDNAETNAKSKKEEVIGELKKNGVPLEVTKLSVGDFVWICRETKESDLNPNTRRLTISKKNDMILPYIVERKRLDDLAHSIKDGRFHEQKFRLEKSGLQSIYLLEKYGSEDNSWGLPEGAITQAIANTQIANEFLIHETFSIKDTCTYLTLMTRHLAKKYQNKKVTSCKNEEWPTLKNSLDETYLLAFNDFNEFGTKGRNWTVSEMFAKHLLRIRGLSVDKAIAITKLYQTPLSLINAYDKKDNQKEMEPLLSSIYFGNNAKTIGKAVSKSVFMAYNFDRYP